MCHYYFGSPTYHLLHVMHLWTNDVSYFHFYHFNNLLFWISSFSASSPQFEYYSVKNPHKTLNLQHFLYLFPVPCSPKIFERTKTKHLKRTILACLSQDSICSLIGSQIDKYWLILKFGRSWELKLRARTHTYDKIKTLTIGLQNCFVDLVLFMGEEI